MSSSHFLRDFIQGRLAAAAVEIFEVFEQTIGQYEREIDRQRRLLDNNWKPGAKLQQSEESQQHICEEEVVLSDDGCGDEQRPSSLDQEEPEPSVAENKEKEIWASENIAVLQLKEETETLSGDETDSSELESELHRFQKMNERVDSESTENAVVKPNIGHCSNNGGKSTISKKRCGDNGGKGVTCDFCGKIFRFRYLLTKHQRIHTGEKPFVCNICGKTFSQMYTLTIHMRSHTGEKPYSCEICGKTFSQRQTAKVHMRIHTGEKPYLCKVCGKRFTESSTYKRHMTTHTNAKRYPCDACGKCFKRHKALLNHIENHHSIKLQP